jgi:hypothetical protein
MDYLGGVEHFPTCGAHVLLLFLQREGTNISFTQTEVIKCTCHTSQQILWLFSKILPNKFRIVFWEKPFGNGEIHSQQTEKNYNRSTVDNFFKKL